MGGFLYPLYLFSGNSHRRDIRKIMKEKIKKIRLDQLLFDRGLAENRSKAKAFIMAGIVKVGEQIITKAGTDVNEDAEVEIVKPPHPYVSRGGLKLEKALDEFNIDVKDRVCIDAGASTGGFTHCMLLRGAQKVYAADVGYGQLDFKLRNDPRVIVLEKCNVRYLSTEQIPETADIITMDLSFISVEKVMGNLKQFLKPDGIMISLIKPQFESERKHCKKGVVHDEEIRKQIVERVVNFAGNIGLKCMGVTESPIKGPKGNKEFLGIFYNQ